MPTNLRNEVFESKSAVEKALVGHVQNSLLNNHKGAIEPILSLLAGNASGLGAYSNGQIKRQPLQDKITTQSFIGSIGAVHRSSGGSSLLERGRK